MRPIIIFLSFVSFFFASGFGENYHDLNSEEKKRVFFAKMNQMLDLSFENIRQERAFVEAFLRESAKNAFRIGSQKNLEKLIELKNKYRVERLFDLAEYQKKIAFIPKSLALAQALVESAVGTSRFAREANNLFGEWTWSGEGLLPQKRRANKNHRIRIFQTLQQSVDSYVLNLNRHFAYEDFREARAEFLERGRGIRGLDAIHSMHSYSENENYIKILEKVIKKYDLEKYDQIKEQNLSKLQARRL